eukprot:6254165-Prymnesium_polylepis.1
MVATCIAGIAGLERGKERNNLHIQAAVRQRLTREPDKAYTELMKRQIKRACSVGRGSGFRTKMTINVFGPGQTWDMMLAYCTKDNARPHFRQVPNSFVSFACPMIMCSGLACVLFACRRYDSP